MWFVLRAGRIPVVRVLNTLTACKSYMKCLRTCMIVTINLDRMQQKRKHSYMPL
jgi:hypothetical protein